MPLQPPTRRLASLFLTVLALAEALACLPAAAQSSLPILSYTLTEVDTTDAVPTGHWAAYLADVCSSPNSLVLEEAQHTSRLLPLSIRTDFFYKQNVSVSASSLGFLALTNASMCPGFCADTFYNTMFGFYQFTNNAAELQTLGGDWPVIALYLSYLSPKPQYGKMCVSELMSHVTPAGELLQWQTLEYVNYTNGVSAGALMGQVTVYSNGTIVLRYNEVPEAYDTRPSGLKPSVGLVLSKKQRIVGSAPLFNGKRLVAKLFTPIRDTCGLYTAQSACTSDTQCGWCSATRLCVSASVSAEQCPRSYFVTSSSPATPTPGTAAAIYDVSITQNSCYHVSSDVRYREVKQSAHVMDWALPLFGVPKDPNASTAIGPFAVGGYHVLPASSHQECNPIWGVCVNGNYTNVIAPFLTSLVAEGSTSTNPFDRMLAYSAFGGFMRVVSPRAHAYATLYSVFGANELWYELYMDVNGNIEFLFGCDPVLTPPSHDDASRSGSNSGSSGSSTSTSSSSASGEVPVATEDAIDYFSQPDAIIGLIRNTVDDPASVIIPPLLIRTGTRVRLSLRTTCPDCGLHGVCDEVTGTCQCDVGFTGTCTQCQAGYYGTSCTKCLPCNNGGVCDDGVTGSGYCHCTGNFGGSTCELACPSTPSIDPSLCLAAGHGFYGCGSCVCTDAYSGTYCDEPPQVSRDPCEQYSLDGCQYCNAESSCQFCFDSYCYSPERAEAGTGHACSRYVLANFTQICRNYPQPTLIGVDLGYVLLGAMTVFLLLVYSMLTVLLLRTCQTLRYLTYDIHATVAAGGIVDYRPVRREREIVQTQLIHRDRARRQSHILGFVLKQISLKKLYKRQRGIGDGTDGANTHARQ